MSLCFTRSANISTFYCEGLLEYGKYHWFGSYRDGCISIYCNSSCHLLFLYNKPDTPRSIWTLLCILDFRSLVKFVWFCAIVTDLGHGWTGAVSHHHTELLPQCQWCHHHLWHHKKSHLYVCAQVDGGCKEIRWIQHRSSFDRWV